MIRQLLQKHGFTPDTHQDQHFLDSEHILNREIEEADLSSTDTVLEIGAGLGNLTRKLAQKAGTVHAIERDKRLVTILQKEFRTTDNITVIQGDAMEIDWPDYDKCVSNPPYHISSSLTEKLGQNQKLSVLTLQKEFAQRLVAQPGSSDYSRLTIMANYYFIPVYLQDIPPSAFYPEPDIDSALVKLYPRPNKFSIQDPDSFLRTVKALFIHKRKKVRNAFVDSRHIIGIDKDQAKTMRDQLPHSQERVINLNMKQLADITHHLEAEL